MTHLKRQKVPKNWPIKRKGTKYVISPNSGLNKGLPLLILLRDVLKIAQNRKEVKRAIHEKNILINRRNARSEKDLLQLFDKITLVSSNKNYKLTLAENGKFGVKEIKPEESKNKISKIVDKKILKGKKTQLNLSDGRNCLSDIKCNVNDSVLIDFEKKQISKCLPLKEKANVIVIAGKHSGETGVIDKINPERKMVELRAKGDNVNILIKQIMIIE